MSESNLLDDTRKLLDERTLALGKISELTGINEHWLRKFQQGKFEDPGVKKVEKLHKFLVQAAA